MCIGLNEKESMAHLRQWKKTVWLNYKASTGEWRDATGEGYIKCLGIRSRNKGDSLKRFKQKKQLDPICVSESPLHCRQENGLNSISPHQVNSNLKQQGVPASRGCYSNKKVCSASGANSGCSTPEKAPRLSHHIESHGSWVSAEHSGSWPLTQKRKWCVKFWSPLLEGSHSGSLSTFLGAGLLSQ